MIRQIRHFLLLICLLSFFLPAAAMARAQQEPVVRAVLFYSPTCPHCHQVINELLLPMVDEQGDRLQILAVDVTQAGGRELYLAAIEHFQLPEERLGVPMLVVGDTVLVGSVEIPAQFPAIVDIGLATGIDWPAVPGLDLPAGQGEPEPEPTATTAPAATATPLHTIAPTATGESETGLALDEASPPPTSSQPAGIAPAGPEPPSVLDSELAEIPLEDAEQPPADPLGFALATTILVAMVAACAYVAWRFVVAMPAWRRAGQTNNLPALSWAIPFIATLGIGVAGYLAYVEITQVEAVCGPVGHCNLVQSSPYARILGIPVALLGIATYLAIIALWLVERFTGRDTWKTGTRAGLIGLTFFGTLFSIYLTLLELFDIRAVCAWCLTSAVVMTILMLLVSRPSTSKDALAFC